MQEMKRFYELMDEHNNAFLEAWGKIHDQEFSS
jgi:hypothetical protein